MTSISVTNEQIQEALIKTLCECMRSAFTHREYLCDYSRISFTLEILKDLGLISSEQYKISMYQFIYMYIKAGESS